VNAIPGFDSAQARHDAGPLDGCTWYVPGRCKDCPECGCCEIQDREDAIADAAESTGDMRREDGGMER
jgi:hypothetical protein